MITCESTFNNTHTDQHYYCFKCKEILCSECLIIHLCSSVHERTSIRKIEEALIEGKVVFVSIKEILQSLKLDSASSSLDNPVEKLLAQKEVEYMRQMDTMQAQTFDVLESINQLFVLFRKKDAQMNNDDYKKSIEALCNELEQIECNWDSGDTNAKLKQLKLISHYEKKSDEITNAVKDKGNKLQNKKYKEKGAKEVGAMLDEIGLSAFVNWHRKQSDAIKQKIRNQVLSIEKYFDDFPIENDTKEKKQKTNGNKTTQCTTMHNQSNVNLNIINTSTDNKPNDALNESITNSLQQGKDDPKQTQQRLQTQQQTYTQSQMELDIENPQEKPSQSSHSQSQYQPINPKKEKLNRINPITMSSSPTNTEFTYKGNCLFSIRKKEITNQVEVFSYINKKVIITELSIVNYQQCYSPQFPFKNSKFINLGNTLLITGGLVDATITNKTYLIQYDNQGQIVINSFMPMLFNREGHNILFIQSTNSIVICSGQLTVTAERMDLNAIDQGSKELPSMNNMRANATLLLLNDNDVYCIGGFNNSNNSYVNGYECLSLTNTSKGWRNVVVNDNLGISTMGFIQFNKSKALLIGGFAGGKKYLQDGFVFSADELKDEAEDNNVKTEKKSQVLNKGIIFYSSPQFFLINDEIVNFDFKQSLIIYNPLTEKARVIQ